MTKNAIQPVTTSKHVETRHATSHPRITTNIFFVAITFGEIASLSSCEISGKKNEKKMQYPPFGGLTRIFLVDNFAAKFL